MTRRDSIATFLGLSAVLALSLVLPPPAPDGRIAHLPSLCPFHRLTGLPCPGCGLTRAFVCLGHGQFASSLHWHPAGWLAYGVLCLLWAQTSLSVLLGRPFCPLPPRIARRLTGAGLATLLLVGAVRLGWALAHPAWRLP